MPTLFISYKRGTAGVNPLRERLEAAKYRTWYDQDDIHAGEDWQKSIDQGIDQSDALIVGLTPGACDSKFVLYEVERAQRQNKPIFPVKLEALNETIDLPKLNLSKTQFIDFTKADPDAWDKAFKRLLDDLQRHKVLQITRHTERAQRGTTAHDLHQRYLRTRIIEPFGRLQLSQIAATGSDGVPLEAVYVDSPTGLAISVEVRDWRVVDWWIDQRGREGRFGTDEKAELPRQRPEALGYEPAALEALIPRIDHQIDAYRKKNPEFKPDDENIYRNRWNNGAHRSALTLQVQDIAAARDRLVVLGAPGSGKSTFVRHLALCLAGAQSDGWTRSAGLTQMGAWPHSALTPVYVELRRFVASKQFPTNISESPTADHLWEYLKAELLRDDLAAYADDLKFDLENGHAILILDGLDEVPYPEGALSKRQKQLRGLAQALNDRYKESRIIVASRPHAYDGWTLPGFEAITIDAFEDAHRIDLGTRLYRAAGLNDANAQAKARALNTALKPVDPELKDRPLFVTLMAIIFLENASGLPTRRGALYRRSILLLLDKWTQSKPDVKSLQDLLGTKTITDLSDRLAALAYDVHAQFGEKPGTPEIPEEWLYKHLKPMGRSVAADLIPYLSENAGVLVSPGQDAERDVFRFAHRSFQEYLAAVQILAACDMAKAFEGVRTLIQAKPDTWREPALLLGDALIDADRADELWDVIDDLLDDDDPPETILSDDRRWWGVWLAARLIEDHQPHEGKLRRSEQAVRDGAVKWLVKLVETAQALPPIERSACGRALAMLGDPRPGVGVDKDNIPVIAWCDVPAGKATIGGDDGFDHSLPETVVSLPAFKMSKYPITYRQFQAFIDAPDGYQTPKWWDGLHEDGKAQQQKGSGEQAFKYSNHPREWVSWYDAMAFCAWLTAKLGYAVRLPTEDEWEAAARGKDQRTYPYGSTFDPTKGNTRESDIGQTSAVGIFPDGASPYGVEEMIGNVWEWTLSNFSQVEISSIDVSNNAARLLRGGSWYGGVNSARAASRGVYGPFVRFSYLGFRVVVVSAPIAPL